MSIRYIREHAPTVPEPTAIEKKHLDLADGIALLLVTEDTTDAAAVSFIQTLRGYSKDKDVDMSDKEALVRYFGIVKRTCQLD